MQDDKKNKETGAEPSAEALEESKQLDRGTFLKALGVGIGAVGLGVIPGGHASADIPSEPEGGRSGIQRLMRGILENPPKAKEFLTSPQTVAQEFGVSLTEAEADKIKDTFLKLAAQVGSGGMDGGLHEGHSLWDHVDGDHHDKYTKALPIQRGGSKIPGKAPTGGSKHR
jgi:hypothetical protein